MVVDYSGDHNSVVQDTSLGPKLVARSLHTLRVTEKAPET